MIFKPVLVMLCLAFGTADDSPADKSSAIKIDSIANRYAFDEFQFEVSRETGAAGIRLQYIYPPAHVQGDEIWRDPAPRIAMLPGLTYDAAAHAVVYDHGSVRTVCAIEHGHRIPFRQKTDLKSTGACGVSTRVNHHERNDGWSISRFDTLDTYFELRAK